MKERRIKQGLEYNSAYIKLMPNNCPVGDRTGDGKSIGPCAYYLQNGTTCPVHGEVYEYVKNDTNE